MLAMRPLVCSLLVYEIGSHVRLRMMVRSEASWNVSWRACCLEVRRGVGLFKLCSRLICNAGGNELGVDDRQAPCIVTALEIKRCVLSGVDTHHLPRI
jgi:hypothetical protein